MIARRGTSLPSRRCRLCVCAVPARSAASAARDLPVLERVVRATSSSWPSRGWDAAAGLHGPASSNCGGGRRGCATSRSESRPRRSRSARRAVGSGSSSLIDAAAFSAICSRSPRRRTPPSGCPAAPARVDVPGARRARACPRITAMIWRRIRGRLLDGLRAAQRLARARGRGRRAPSRRRSRACPAPSVTIAPIGSSSDERLEALRDQVALVLGRVVSALDLVAVRVAVAVGVVRRSDRCRARSPAASVSPSREAPNSPSPSAFDGSVPIATSSARSGRRRRYRPWWGRACRLEPASRRSSIPSAVAAGGERIGPEPAAPRRP